MVSPLFSDISPCGHWYIYYCPYYWVMLNTNGSSFYTHHWNSLRCFVFPPKFLHSVSFSLSAPCVAHNTTSSSFDWSSLCVSCLAGIYLLSALATSGTIKHPCCYQKSEFTSTSVCWHSRVPSLFSSSLFCCCFMTNQVTFHKYSMSSFSISFQNSRLFCFPVGCTLLCFFSPFVPVNI